MTDRHLLVDLGREMRPARWESGSVHVILARAPGIQIQMVSAVETAKPKRVTSEELIPNNGALGLTDSQLLTAASFMPPTPSVVDEFPSRMTLSHGVARLDHGTERPVLDHIDWIRSRGDDWAKGVRGWEP